MAERAEGSSRRSPPVASSSVAEKVLETIHVVDPTERKKAAYAKRDSTKVYLLDTFDRWRDVRARLHLHKDKDLANFLLDLYESGQQKDDLRDEDTMQTDTVNPTFHLTSPITTKDPDPVSHSTPITHIPRQPVSLELFQVESTLSASGFEDMDETLSAMESDDDTDDSDSLLSELSGLSEIDYHNLERQSVEDSVYDTDVGGHSDDEDTKVPDEVSPSTQRSDDVIASREAISMKKCIVFSFKLLSLVKEINGSHCTRPHCSKVLEYKESYIGTCLVISWGCNAVHHGGKWSSQPRCENLRAGNLLLASALVLSGNSFSKIGMMFRFLNLQYISYTLFNQYQNLYIAPTVSEYWSSLQNNIWEDRAGKDVILSGDGRNDSPGHSAQYCTYSLADMETKAILQINVVDVRETEGRKSTKMERIGFERGMDSVFSSDMSVKEVVTDGHTEIAALFNNQEKFKNIVHQRDVWHGGKNLMKKVITASQGKGKEDLGVWVSAVRNHFWYCCKSCGGSVNELKEMWIGILHHIANEHEWLLADGASQAKCAHIELNEQERDKPWLKKNSSPHNALRDVVLSKYLLRSLKYYVNFRHTGFLESFHNHLLMYAPKRHSYSYIGYKMRNEIAVIDFNKHLVREVDKTSDGKERYRAQYSKRTKQWRAVPILKPKKYTYIPDLMEKIFHKRHTVDGPVVQRIGLTAENPRNIARNIATVQRPTVAQIRERHQSRFT